MKFLDRVEERARLMRLLNGADGAFACLYGRRRCGKTRLLHECVAGLPNTIYYLADRSARPAQVARFIKEASRVLPAFAAASPNDWGAALDLWTALAPRGAVLILDEFPYLVEKDDALPSVLQRIIDRIVPTGHKIVICGSSQRMMQGLVLKASEPLYGRAREILPIRPLEFGWLQEAFPKMTPFQRLQLWGVWGGVPRYWELQEDASTLWQAVRHQVTAPFGLLRNEPNYLLLDDVGDVAQASAVLAFVGEGAHRATEIAARMQRPVTDMTRPLLRLSELGLIAKDIPFGADEKSKKSFYRISDQFLDFWYTYVWPNWSRDDFLETEDEQKSFEKTFNSYLGGVWERLVAVILRKHGLPGVEGRLRGCRRWWGNGLNRVPMEIDVVAESVDGTTLVVGEAKLSLTKREAEHALSELKAKTAQLPFVRNYQRVVHRLFVAKGGAYECLDLRWAERACMIQEGKSKDLICRPLRRSFLNKLHSQSKNIFDHEAVKIMDSD